MIATVNPATGECLVTFDPLTESQLDEKLARADAAFRTYRRTSFAERAGVDGARGRDSGSGEGRLRRAS